jgi:hypothetical protein
MQGILDLHVHAAPSLFPRRYDDRQIAAVARQAGVSTLVLKAHEGSTAERARLAGPDLLGGVVLNSTVGGASPDAVRVAAGLGAKIVWLPTASAEAHIAGERHAELSVHRPGFFSPVPLCEGGRLLPEWLAVFDEVAAHELVLASGHLSVDEAVCAFRAAKERGVRRLLVNHPLLPFMGWRREHAAQLREMDARLEVGVLPDHLAGTRPSPTEILFAVYPAELLVFGSDLGHTAFPDYPEGLRDWIERTAPAVGDTALAAILTANGRELLGL